MCTTLFFFIFFTLCLGRESTGGNGFFTFLKDSLLDTTSLGKSDLRGGSRSNHKGVTQSGAEGVTLAILNGDNVERSIVLLNVHDSPNTPTVVSTSDHNHGSQVELEDIGHLSGGNINLDAIVDLDIRVGVSDGATIMSYGNGDLSARDVNLVDTAELVLGFCLLNSVKNVSPLNIEQESESVVGLFQFDNIHETSRVILVSSDLAVNLDASLHANLLALLSGQGVLKTLSKDNSDRQTVSELVGTLRGSGGPDTSHLGHIPVGRRMEALQVLLGSASPAKVKVKDKIILASIQNNCDLSSVGKLLDGEERQRIATIVVAPNDFHATLSPPLLLSHQSILFHLHLFKLC
jgi:hypothetical protein